MEHGQNHGSFISDTKELNWDIDKGTLLVNTPFIQGGMGMLKAKSDSFLDLKLDIDTPFASVFLVSSDGLPLKESRKMLLVCASRQMNDGMRFNKSRTVIVNPGQSPILLEKVKGRVSLPKTGKFAVISI